MKKLNLSKMEFPINLLEHKFFNKEIIKKIKFININKYKNNNKLINLIKKIKIFLNSKKKIILGSGSDELIFFLISCYIKKKYKFIGSFYPSFFMYEFYSIACNKKFIRIKLDKNFDFSKKKLSLLINKKKLGIFFISYPNNPTGNLFDKKKIIYLLEKCKNTLFVLDEAYYYFSKKTFIYLKNENLIILRTLSKIGLAGIRIGMLMCEFKLYNNLITKRSPYIINSISLKFLEIFLKKKYFKYINIFIKKIINDRKVFSKKLQKKLFNSFGNFFLVKNKYYKSVYKILNKKNIVFKNIFFNNKNYLRFSLWNRKTNKMLLNLLK
ncbi:aminotransferase class I/II-fold pyridoxal phosphate-dependent enzyme [Candidatus Vidania fulgoroideorum]